MSGISDNISKNPLKQGLIISLLSILLIIVLSSIPGITNWSWKIAASSILFFTVANTILSITQSKFSRYILKSFLTYLFMMAGLILIAWMFSGNEKEQIRYYKIIFPCLLLFYLMLIGLAALLRNILKSMSGMNPDEFFGHAGERKSPLKSS